MSLYSRTLEAKLATECDRLRARVAELEKGIEEYACTGADHPCGCYDLLSKDRARVAELEGLLRECSDDLAAEIEHRYDRVKDHPAMTSRYERDMDIVVRARALLENTAR